MEGVLSDLVGSGAAFHVRHELGLPPLEGADFFIQLLSVLGTAPLLLIVGVLLLTPVTALTSRSTAENLRGIGLLVVGLLLAYLVPCTLGLTALMALEGGAESLDTVVGGGLAVVLLVYAIPVGLMGRQRRLHEGTPLWELLGAPLLPLAAGGLYVAALQHEAVFDNPFVIGLYEGALAAGAITPAWIGLSVLGGFLLLTGLVLAPVGAQGLFDVLGALKGRLLG